MLNWSLDLYKKIQAINYNSKAKGLDIGLNFTTKYSNNISYPLELIEEKNTTSGVTVLGGNTNAFSPCTELEITENGQIGLCLDNLNIETIRALERLKPVVFLGNSYLEQIKIKKGLNQNQVISKALTMLLNNKELKIELKEKIKYNSRDSMQVASELDKIIKLKFKEIKKEYLNTNLNIKKEALDLINSNLDSCLSNELHQFI